MRLPRVRVTVRRLMVVVAVAALILGAEAMRRRSATYRRRAQYHAGMERAAFETARFRRELLGGSGLDDEAIDGPDRRRAAYRARLSRKYERAARYPWLPVAPDPPEPE